MKRRQRKALDERIPELVQLARSAVPREACGLIEWDGARMTLRPCENVSTQPTDSFMIAPAEQIRHLSEIEAAGTEFWGVYHSHPTEGASPSERDRAFATQLQVTWVIVGLRPTGVRFADDSPLLLNSYDVWIGRP